MERERRSVRERGLGVLEVLIAMVVAVVLLGVALHELVDALRLHHRESQAAEMRAGARNLMEFMSRELLSAGYGFTTMPLSFPSIIANEPQILDTFTSSTITFRYNETDVQSKLIENMATVSSPIRIATVNGFAPDRRALIWDGGAWDWVNVTTVSSPNQLNHNGALSQVYLVGDDSTVAVIKEITFRYVADRQRLERREDAGEWVPIAENVSAFELHYYNEEDTELFPIDDTARADVRAVEIRLTVDAKERNRISGRRPSYTLQNRIRTRNDRQT